jgi:protein-L-isoaspartate(D-aspartate) O-methyltransferase
MMRKLALLAVIFFTFAHQATAEEADYVRERAAMVETIRAYAKADERLLGAEGIAENILNVMARTKRHLFVPELFRSLAYSDGPLRIGHDQTISQPFIVALMTHLAKVEPEHTALEVGTGSGYQAAVLAQLVRKVCTIEIVPPLGEAAAKRLKDLGYENVSVRIGDGYEGWPECGPFDAIIVTAALGQVPQPLIEQLKVGGRLVMPVGSTGGIQQLTVVERITKEKTKTRVIAPVRFVPFTRSRN